MVSHSLSNVAAIGVSYYTPAQDPPVGTAITPQPADKAIPLLFQPIQIRGVKFQNRIFLSPLGQDSAENGHFNRWHLTQLGGIISRGPGLSMIESTAVLPEGRTSPQATGLYLDSHIEPLRQIVEFAHSQNQKIGIQLCHGGRKASSIAPWIGQEGVSKEDVGGWPGNIWGPIDVEETVDTLETKQAPKEYLRKAVESFAASATRAVKAGVDVIEIHAAHGYLLNSFLSPVTNKRTDEYGGSFENRIRLTLEVVDAIRSVIPEDMPLFLRISATDWLEESLPDVPSWRSSDTVRLAPILSARGVDFLDISSGGNHIAQQIKGAYGPAYQAFLAEDVKRSLPADSKLLVGCVGGIKNGHVANEILEKGQADVVLLGTAFLKNPGSVWAFADDLGVDTYVANQWEWGASKATLAVPYEYDRADIFPSVAWKGRGSRTARQIQNDQSIEAENYTARM